MFYKKVLTTLTILLLAISASYADNFNIEFVGATEGSTYAVAVSADGNTAYIGAGVCFYVVDVSNKNDPVLQGKVYTPGGIVMDIAVVGDYAYVADHWEGLQIISVTDPSNPTLTGSFDTSGSAKDVSVVGDLVYVADEAGGLCILRFNDPTQIIMGDVSGDGTVTAYDAALVYQHVAGLIQLVGRGSDTTR